MADHVLLPGAKLHASCMQVAAVVASVFQNAANCARLVPQHDIFL